MTEKQLASLRADAPKFIGDRESLRCDECWHNWELVWFPDRLAYAPVRPIGRVLMEKACADCLKRLKKWNERRTPGRPKRQRIVVERDERELWTASDA